MDRRDFIGGLIAGAASAPALAYAGFINPSNDENAGAPTNAAFPAKMQGLFKPSRYKVLYGGRGAARSWSVARWLLLEGAKRKIHVLCARELQKSLDDSVKKLLADQITLLKLDHVYDIQQAVIRSITGSEFHFEGIRHNINKIKSYEGVDYCWVEEAQAVSAHSWEVLVPTIRKPGSEIIVTFNPDLESDPTYDRFVAHTPPNCQLIFTTWRDNPWFASTELPAERDELKARNYDAYLWVWEGQCRKNLEGAVYAEELREARGVAGAPARICRVPYDRSVPVCTYWDLGRSDHTSIWFVQQLGFEWHIVDFYQSNLHHIDHYLGVLQNRGYVLGTLWLPHDARAKQLGSKMTIEEQARGKFPSVRIVPRVSIKDKIHAARTVFPNCWFDEVKCAEGIHALTHYKYAVDPATKQFSQTPLHDENSDAASAFEYFALASRMPNRRPGGLMARLIGRGSEAEGEDHLGLGPGQWSGEMGRPTAWLGR